MICLKTVGAVHTHTHTSVFYRCKECIFNYRTLLINEDCDIADGGVLSRQVDITILPIKIEFLKINGIKNRLSKICSSVERKSNSLRNNHEQLQLKRRVQRWLDS